MDSKNRIARSNVYSLFGEILMHQISKNEDYKVILAKAGLKDLTEDYYKYLTPYWYNRGYQNKNPEYNPQYACLDICEKIEDSSESLTRFFNVILENTTQIESGIINKLERYLGELGFELKIENDEHFINYIYSLIPLTHGAEERTENLDFFSSNLSSDLLALYNEALQNYGNGSYLSCIDNCRSLFEAFFKRFDPHNDYAKGILAVTKEQIVEKGTVLDSQKKIFNYWINNKKGANRYRLFVTLYSVMSGLGTHREEVATIEDALMLLRFTEDVLIWCFKKGIV